MTTQPVVFDVNVLVSAVAGGNSPFRSWPSPPPTSDNSAADCVGIVNDGKEFALWLSPHVLTNVVRVLIEGFSWDSATAQNYAELLVEMAEAVDGGVADPVTTVTDCADHEDNRILELAMESEAMLIVSNDSDRLSLTPWRVPRSSRHESSQDGST